MNSKLFKNNLVKIIFDKYKKKFYLQGFCLN